MHSGRQRRLLTAMRSMTRPSVSCHSSRGIPRAFESNDKLGLYLLDIDRGVATLVAQEPAPGLTHCGSARWSSDGKRILFDATPGSNWDQTHLFAVDSGETRPRITDLGPGNCPSPSPDGKQIAFLLNSGAVPDAQAGLWIMNSDGSGRRPLGSHGRPYWSPDNRRLLIVSFSDPCELTLLDVDAGKTLPVLVPGLEVRSIPSWVNPNTIVAALGTEDARTIALVDLTDPQAGQDQGGLARQRRQAQRDSGLSGLLGQHPALPLRQCKPERHVPLRDPDRE